MLVDVKGQQGIHFLTGEVLFCVMDSQWFKAKLP